MSKVETWIQGANRKVVRTDIDGAPARAIIASRTYPTTPSDMWDAFTNPERLARWFIPTTIDARVGGRFDCEGVAGGEILECIPEQFLRVRWGTEKYPDDEVQLRLTPTDDGEHTIVEIQHATTYDVIEFQGEQVKAFPRMGTGWDATLANLGRHVWMQSDDLVGEWIGTDEGGEFFAGVGPVWDALASEAGMTDG